MTGPRKSKAADSETRDHLSLARKCSDKADINTLNSDPAGNEFTQCGRSTTSDGRALRFAGLAHDSGPHPSTRERGERCRSAGRGWVEGGDSRRTEPRSEMCRWRAHVPLVRWEQLAARPWYAQGCGNVQECLRPLQLVTCEAAETTPNEAPRSVQSDHTMV
jgi:hypothetical protein